MVEITIALCVLALVALSIAVFGAIRATRPRSELAQRLAEMEERLQARLDTLAREGQSAAGQQMGQLAVTLTDGIARVREETRTRVEEALSRSSAELRSGFELLRASLEQKLGESITQNFESFGAVAGRLEELHRATGQVIALSANIEELNRALATPKGRGAFGEFSLSQLLKDLLPSEYYCEQWIVEDGARVDAALLLREGAIPIDAKFTLVPVGAEDSPEVRREFARTVEGRAREIAQKYIRPPRTLEFAFMFVPAESVFYRIVLDRDLHQKLLAMRVIPTSPNSLYAYFQALAIGLRGIKIEEKAHEIERILGALRIDFFRFADHFRKLGSHLENARSQFSSAERDVSRFKDRLESLRLGIGDDPSGGPESAIPSSTGT